MKIPMSKYIDPPSMTFDELKQVMVDFVDSRGEGWKRNNYAPKNMLFSAFIELGELAEKFQWDQLNDLPKDDVHKKEIAYELVDVFNYLFMFTHACGIDLPSALVEKMDKLDKKYPKEKDYDRDSYNRVKDEYRRSGKNKLY